jgi:hypothetical protein
MPNIAASVRARLRNVAATRNEPVELLLTRYVLERLLYRLSTTEHRKRFVLKGAMLMRMWFDMPFRPTRDLDLLGFGDPDPEAMLAIFRGICSIQLDDGSNSTLRVYASTASARTTSMGVCGSKQSRRLQERGLPLPSTSVLVMPSNLKSPMSNYLCYSTCRLHVFTPIREKR